MSPSPDKSTETAPLEEYAQGWDAMVKLVKQGHSWSGHERGVCYLNRTEGQFSNVSYLSGLDLPDDGRGLGLVDWDRDGDLDVWFRNRTAPRLRLMRNEHGQDQPFLSIQLQGTTCNRDAIGAVVEVLTKGGKPLVKSLRAGDLFLSQSSKSLHFGLGDHAEIRTVNVLWPGGARESFPGARAGQRVRLVQGSGQAAVIEVPPATQELAIGSLTGKPNPEEAMVVLPTRVPLSPSFHYRDQSLQSKVLTKVPKGRLLLFWSARCALCRAELKALAGARASLQNGGLEVVALCVDSLDDPSGAYALIDEVAWPFSWGFVDEETLRKLETLQHTMFDSAVPLSVPLALVLDGQNNIVALNRGKLTTSPLLSMLPQLMKADKNALHHLAPPLAGRWFTNPVPVDFVMENLSHRIAEKHPEEALPYLQLAYQHSQGGKRTHLKRQLGMHYYRLAQQRAETNQPKEAVAAFENALLYTPDSPGVYHDYGILMARSRQYERARVLLEQALTLDPNSKPTAEALRMIEQALSQ